MSNHCEILPILFRGVDSFSKCGWRTEMKVSPTRSYEGKTVIQSYRREQLGWDLELVRNMNSKLELIRYCSDRSTLPFIRDFPVNEHIVRPPPMRTKSPATYGL